MQRRSHHVGESTYETLRPTYDPFRTNVKHYIILIHPDGEYTNIKRNKGTKGKLEKVNINIQPERDAMQLRNTTKIFIIIRSKQAKYLRQRVQTRP